jgi:heme/copper-type cytochrome/quinol oxidase subunit 2
MPIAVRVVSQDEYDAWVAGKKSVSIDTKGKLASARD